MRADGKWQMAKSLMPLWLIGLLVACIAVAVEVQPGSRLMVESVWADNYCVISVLPLRWNFPEEGGDGQVQVTTNVYTGPMIALSAAPAMADGLGMFIESTVDLVNWGPYPGLTQYVILSNEVRYVVADEPMRFFRGVVRGL